MPEQEDVRRERGNLLFILLCVGLAMWAAIKFVSAEEECRVAYDQRMYAAADSLRRNHGLHTHLRLPTDPPGTMGDTLYVWWYGDEVKAVWPAETPRRRLGTK